jgi:hypothetical protein
MKKIVLILTLAFIAVCLSNAQEIRRSLKAGDWEITLEENVTYIIESNEINIIIKEGETDLHSLLLPEIFIFSSIDLTTFEEGVIINGVKWATRNLAAHGKFVEKPEDFGALFQWGRVGDGHEQRTSPLYPTNDTSIENGIVIGLENFDADGQIVNTHVAYGKFIKQNDLPWDWRIPQNDSLWNSGNDTIPIKTLNDPCPEGWRLPTTCEIASLGDGQWTNTPIAGCHFGNGTDILFLPAAGNRSSSNGLLEHFGTTGYYWSSAPTGFMYEFIKYLK